MKSTPDEFLRSLRATFTVEAEEHLQAIATGLLELEKTPAPEARRRLVETVFRAAHSLKGASRAVNCTDVELICHSLEDVFAGWKRQADMPEAQELEKAHQALNAVTAALAAVEVSAGELHSTVQLTGGPSVQWQEESRLPTEGAQPARIAIPKAPAAEETVRIAVAKLDARLVEAEDMLTAKQTARRQVAELLELARHGEAWSGKWRTVEPDVRALRHALARPAFGGAALPPDPGLARLLEFLDWNLSHFKSLEDKVTALTWSGRNDCHVLGKHLDDLLENSKKLLLLPFSTLATSFPKLVRDLCREQGKQADLVIRGDDVEIDKRILEEMKDPLIHLLRNGVDHGVETPESRTRQGKPARAVLTLAVSQVDGGKVQIILSDDGAGLSLELIKDSAVNHGILSVDDARRLSDDDARRLVFHADVSTSPILSRVSGRGLGLAIAREKTEALRGVISVESRPAEGTRFRIVLPSMLATFRGILIDVAARLFVVPTVHVEHVARVNEDKVLTVEGRETIALGGRALSLVRLADVLGLPSMRAGDQPRASFPVLVVALGEERIAFAVDTVRDEQEVLVKPLRKPLSRVRHIAGATVLGSGELAPVLNVGDLLKSARKAGRPAAASTPVAKPPLARAVLVVEDSITSRMLIKGMLESAGYTVKTAVDGIEAITLLRSEKFDRVVSDVEMPRLNGLDLTATIRADKTLADLPVVLVTALETREDRERGIEVGASAYLVKSRFEEGNLLETVRRLI